MKKLLLLLTLACSLSAKGQQMTKSDTVLVIYLNNGALGALNDIISKTEASYAEVNALLSLLQYQASLQNKKQTPKVDSADKKHSKAD